MIKFVFQGVLVLLCVNEIVLTQGDSVFVQNLAFIRYENTLKKLQCQTALSSRKYSGQLPKHSNDVSISHIPSWPNSEH